MYPYGTTQMYLYGTPGLRLYLKVSLSFFSYFLSLNITEEGWTTLTDNWTKLFFGNGQSPKRTEPDTRPDGGLANIAGSDRPMWFAWSTIGADCAPPKLPPDNNPRAGGRPA